MARIYRRPGTRHWQCSYRIPGGAKVVRESTGANDEASARRFLEGRIRETGYSKAVGPITQRIKFADLEKLIVSDYQVKRHELRNLQNSLTHLRAAFGNYRACEITAIAVANYAADRVNARAANGSVNRELAALRRMFKLALKHGIAGQAPYIELLPEGKSRTAFFELGEFERVRDAMPLEMRDYLSALFFTGVRRTQMAALEWRDVFREGARVVMRAETTKNGEPHIVPLAGEFGAIIERARAARRLDCRFVFHREGRPFCYPDGSLDAEFRAAWEHALDATGLAGRWLHDLRRSAATHLARSGVPEQVAMRITGHKTPGMYRRYNIIDERAVAAAMRQQRDFLAHATPGARGTGVEPR